MEKKRYELGPSGTIRRRCFYVSIFFSPDCLAPFGTFHFQANAEILFGRSDAANKSLVGVVTTDTQLICDSVNVISHRSTTP
jgi:hypothetical protein